MYTSIECISIYSERKINYYQFRVAVLHYVHAITTQSVTRKKNRSHSNCTNPHSFYVRMSLKASAQPADAFQIENIKFQVILSRVTGNPSAYPDILFSTIPEDISACVCVWVFFECVCVFYLQPSVFGWCCFGADTNPIPP